VKRKTEKHIIFQISKFSLRNFISVFNLIIFLSTLVFFLGGIFYAFLYTPKFQASGLLRSQPYAQINEISSNPLKDKKDTAPRTLQEMDLIKTHSVFKKTVEMLYLNLEIQEQIRSPLKRVNKFFTNDAAWQKYQATGNNPLLSSQGRLIRFSQLHIPKKWWGKEITITNKSSDAYELTLPDGKRISCQFKRICESKAEQFSWIIEAIYSNFTKSLRIKILNPDLVAEKLKSAVTVSVPNETDKHGELRSPLMQSLIQVSYTGQNPILSAAIINQLMDTAIAFSKGRKEQESKNAYEILSLQEKMIFLQIERTNNEIALLKNQHQPLNAEAEAQYMLKRLNFLQETIITLRQKEQELKQRMTVSNPQLQSLTNELNLLKKEEQELNQSIKNNPMGVKRLLLLESEQIAQLDVLKNVIAQKQLLDSFSQSGFSDLQIVERAAVPLVSVDYSRTELILMISLIGLIIGYVIATALV
jgi:uncharacterized protein involved in exopolysaccharide biosynthesis